LRLTPEEAAPLGAGASGVGGSRLRGGGGDGDKRHTAPEWRTGDAGRPLRPREISLSDLILLPFSSRFLFYSVLLPISVACSALVSFGNKESMKPNQSTSGQRSKIRRTPKIQIQPNPKFWVKFYRFLNKFGVKWSEL
jgi:hypothetical protein